MPVTSQTPETIPPTLEEYPLRRELLLAWFVTSGRDLPWRHTRDPYRILVAEIMLQQTQVDRVLPKYQAFLEAFPTLQRLAEVPVSEVIRAWAGLGYNRRAVNLQRTARMVLEQFDGQFPRDVVNLRRLPGIGPYTAGAVACFAFEQDVAFIDTNIRRVVQRLLLGETDPSETRILAAAQAAVPPGRGWAWNQAIMELGALICTASAPACWRCPVASYCPDYTARKNAEPYALDTTPQPRRRVAERRETRYAGSNRFYRGRLIAVLRQQPSGLPLSSIGPLLKPDFSDADLPWLNDLAAGLARDGLLTLDDGTIRLPE